MNQACDPDAMCGELETPPPAAPQYPYQSGLAIQKVRYTHDAMIDMIIMEPAISQNELARRFGYTAGWVSLVMSSDAFKERLEARKGELIDPTIRASLDERFRAVISRSLEILSEKLSAPASVVPDNLALQAAALGAKALGLGAREAPPPPAPPSDHLDRLAERLIALQRRVTVGVLYEAELVEDAVRVN